MDNRCPICNSSISGTDKSHAGFAESGLCSICGRHYGNNLSRALYKYERELWLMKCGEATDRRESKLTIVGIDGNGIPVAETKHRNYIPTLGGICMKFMSREQIISDDIEARKANVIAREANAKAVHALNMQKQKTDEWKLGMSKIIALRNK